MSGELDTTIADKYRILAYPMEAELNNALIDKNYGSAIEDIGIIPVLITPELLNAGFFKERRLFKRKEKSADYRLRINYEKFLNGNDVTRRLLIIKNIIVSIRDLGRKAKKDFDAQSLENDILATLGVTSEDVNKIEIY
jgi:hypothetical protein